MNNFMSGNVKPNEMGGFLKITIYQLKKKNIYE